MIVPRKRNDVSYRLRWLWLTAEREEGRARRVEEGGMGKEGRWWVYERERASRIEGSLSPLGSLSADSLGSHLFYVPGQGQIIHSPLRPLNCLRPHRSFCHLPPSRRLFIGLPAVNVVAHHRLLGYPQSEPCLTLQTLQGCRTPGLLFLFVFMNTCIVILSISYCVNC